MVEGGVPPRRPPDLANLACARAALVARDPAMAALDAQVPPLAWRTLPAGFPGLLRLIVGQQVSTVSADACWARLQAQVGAITPGQVTPAAVAALDAAALRAVGFSGQKAAYAHPLAAAHRAGCADPAALDDAAAAAALTAHRGVVRWTAAAYLMMSEGRLDAWPGGDIALQEAIRWIDRLPARPDEAAACARAELWRPYRAVAAHWLWAYYLGVKAGEIAPPPPDPEPPCPPPSSTAPVSRLRRGARGRS